ncbi:phosphoribosylformylglycinamidine synthase II domain-containing protein [Wolbachia endosymbiont of Glossina morsitans morsitans]|nr:phosphoribosylformylglycinamidine synthase II domain-containing protein [Wolbachia endosymbiont of Glossina morsitans morsitans]
MTDNVGNTAKQIVREYLINKDYIDENVYIKTRSSKLILSQGNLPTEHDIKQEFNPITEYCTLICKNYSWKYYGKSNTPPGVIPVPRHWDPENFKQLYNENWIPVSSTGMTGGETGMTEGRAGDTHPCVIPARDQEKENGSQCRSTGMTREGTGMTEKKAGMTGKSTGVISSSNGAKSVDLNISDQELEKISRDGIDGNGALGLSLAAMRAIKDYFKKLNRNPYDIELESLAQTWNIVSTTFSALLLMK